MKKILLILLLSFTLFPEEDVEIDKDPFENINRVVFVIFDEIDVAVLKLKNCNINFIKDHENNSVDILEWIFIYLYIFFWK